MKQRLIYSFVLIILLAVCAQGQPKVTFKPYGFFKMDAAFDQARTNDGNYVFWVNNVPDGADKDHEFNMTARQTRLGGWVNVSEYEGKTVTGRFEFDFYGGGPENKNLFMMRHAYLKIDFEEFYILAGQTSDVIAPLVPSTVNYPVLWGAGNPGYRRPQFQIGNRVKEGVQVVGALTRNIAGDYDGDGFDDGEDQALPAIQGRFSYLIPGKLNIGVSGHYGRMQYTKAGNDESYDSYSLNGHLQYTASDQFSIKGEAFWGQALSQYLAGIMQGFNLIRDKSIESMGGWANATVKVDEKTQLNFGGGVDKPEQDTLTPGQKDFNMSVFGNFFTRIAYNTRLAGELSYWKTGYYNGSGSDRTSSVRGQMSLIFNF